MSSKSQKKRCCMFLPCEGIHPFSSWDVVEVENAAGTVPPNAEFMFELRPLGLGAWKLQLSDLQPSSRRLAQVRC